MKAIFSTPTAPLMLLAMLAAPIIAQAQVATTLYGSLSNFDVVNNTGQETQGFEIQIEGVTPQDIIYEFGAPYIRYGSPSIVPYLTGVYVRYMSPWDPAAQAFVTSTPVAAAGFPPTGGHLCYNLALGAAYLTSGCEHFGVSLARNPTATTYRWLVADPQNPGSLTALDPPVAIPAPIWTVVPAAQAAAPPVVVAEVVAPEQPRQFQFGEAQWMKVYKTELPRAVDLAELLSDDPIVPQDPAQIESAWTLLQAGGNGKRNRNRNQGALGGKSQSVVRRYEFYKYTGAYDPITHEALCLDLKCNLPDPAEVGDYIGAQMAAANLNVPVRPVISVSTTGSGSVSGSVGGIKCGAACSATVDSGTAATFTASPAGTVFTGWGGACSGTQLTCSLTVNADAAVTATFTPTFTLSMGRGGKGTVTSDLAGINCGSSCSAKFLQGAVVTLTATPAAGLKFVNWGGACSGTVASCAVTINGNTSVQANFK